MTTHIMAMTYAPKVEGVKNGTIRQTIRRFNPKNPFKLGDKLLIHGWSGKPYRSPWSWRLEAKVKELDKLLCDCDMWALVDHYDLTHSGYCTAAHPWDSTHPIIDKIAKADGITPPTGMSLKLVLEGFHNMFGPDCTEFQVIRW